MISTPSTELSEDMRKFEFLAFFFTTYAIFKATEIILCKVVYATCTLSKCHVALRDHLVTISRTKGSCGLVFA